MTDTDTHSTVAPAARRVDTARLLGAVREGAGPGDLRRYRQLHPRPAPAIPGRPDQRLIEMVDQSGLRGRGGAGFPTGRKLRTVASARQVPIVVVNATEGEPISHKDHYLALRGPHLLLDGAARAAAAVGAERIQVCIDREDRDAVAALRAAVAERSQLEPGGTPVEVLGTPPRYVAGEETALVHWINGGEAKPTMTPPRPFERGVDKRPTLINNAETVSHLALVAERGPGWFRELGTAEEPGTCLVTVTGAVGQARVVEVGIGAPMATAIRAASGLTQAAGAVLVGGYFGAWLPPSAIDSAGLSNARLGPFGASLGCGAIHVLPASGCGVLETARILDWYSAESAGQCGPCVHGLAALAGGWKTLTMSGRAEPDRLARWADEIEHRGACALPDGAARFVRSALAVFADHVELHRRGHRCAASQQAGLLPVPRRRGGPIWR